MDSSRAQLLNADLLLAVTLFAVALGAIMLTWNFTKARMEEASWSRELEQRTYTISDVLVRTPGDPVDWESQPAGNITSMGLAGLDGGISQEKVAALKRVDPQRLNGIFQLGKENWHIILRGGDGSIINRAGPAPAGDYAVKSTRIVSYMNRTAFLEFTLWGAKPDGGILL